jgi:DNA-binding CsgD family transcriptional regulator/tetratricopeptide (TPR) repeat protein
MEAASTRPLIGRAAEVRALHEIIEQTVRGGRVVVIEGEAGIGKTRLLHEALAYAEGQGFQVFSAEAEELDGRRPFGIIADCFGIRSGVDLRRKDIARHLYDDSEPAADSGPEFRVVEEFVALVDHLSAERPLVLALDDVQWADPSSLLVIHRLVRQFDRQPVLVVIAARPLPRRAELVALLAGLPSSVCTRLQLTPLEAETWPLLVESACGVKPGDDLLRRVAAAGGNPLFVTELVSALMRTQTTPSGSSAADALPAGLAETILHRLSFLSADTLHVLGMASVLGGVFSVTELSLLSGRLVAQLLGPLSEALRTGVLSEQADRLAFRHQLIREALYESLPVGVRKGLHREVWRSLAAAGAPAMQVAEHVTRAASPGDREAVEWLHRAAVEVGSLAPAAAVDLLQRALELTDVAEEARRRLLPDLAVSLIWSGRLKEGESACQQALSWPGGVVDESWMRLCLAQALVLLDRAGDARREAEAATAAVTASPPTRVRASAWASLARLNAGDRGGAVEQAERARLDAERLGDAPARCQALATLSLAADVEARFQDAAELAELAAREAERSGTREAHRALAHLVLGRALADLDRLEEAHDYVRKGRLICEQLGARGALPSHHFTASLCLFAAGRWDDALAEIETGLDLAEEMGVGWRNPACVTGALIALHRDDFWQAEAWLRRAEAEAAAPGGRYQVDRVRWVQALLQEASGHPDKALAQIVGAWDGCERSGLQAELPVLGPDLVRLAVRAGADGDGDRTRRTVRALESLAARNPSVSWVAGAALRARGAADDDLETLLRAVSVYRQGPRPLERAQACEDAGTASIQRGDLTGGRVLLEEAHAVYDSLHAQRDLRRVRASLRAAGVRGGQSGRRRRPKLGWQALTETELVVVRLVAERLSNPEIAERLFLSRRTVQTHVSHALTKLNLGTRVELASEAQRHGWRLRLEQVGTS